MLILLRYFGVVLVNWSWFVYGDFFKKFAVFNFGYFVFMSDHNDRNILQSYKNYFLTIANDMVALPE